MKNIRLLIAVTLTLAGIGIIGITAHAVSQLATVRGVARSGNITLLVNAVQRSDGSIDGRATFRDSQANTRTDVQIDCIAFNNPSFCPTCDPQPKSAVLTGVITSSNDPRFSEEPVGFAVQDFGNGKDSLPDQFTSLMLSKQSCRLLEVPYFLQIESGQILVNAGE